VTSSGGGIASCWSAQAASNSAATSTAGLSNQFIRRSARKSFNRACLAGR
jgi:hypothetical protein